MTQIQATDIERDTQGQAKMGLWFYHRRIRITASNFGRVAKRRATTPVSNLVKSLLYTKHVETKEMRWGKTHEKDAKSAYVSYLKKEGYHNAEVVDSGLVIDTEDPCLGCSPDAIVNIPDSGAGPHGIAEFKCPYTAQSMTPQEAAATSKPGKFCSSVTGSGTLKLKANHNYYYQVQGTLAITKRQWCDFVIWTPKGMSVERITADSQFWESAKLKIVAFYKKAVLPELALPRFTSGQAIREPQQEHDHDAQPEASTS